MRQAEAAVVAQRRDEFLAMPRTNRQSPALIQRARLDEGQRNRSRTNHCRRHDGLAGATDYLPGRRPTYRASRGIAVFAGSGGALAIVERAVATVRPVIENHTRMSVSLLPPPVWLADADLLPAQVPSIS
jgi:hypothetical protein